MRTKLRLLRWLFAAALVLLGSGCIKVRHLGDDVGKSFYKTFRHQRRRSDPDTRVWLKPMEAELAEAAAAAMVGPKNKSTRSITRRFTNPTPNSGGD